ncbi:asparagine synthase (glutamine-hydrolyzing) [Hahella aquimaris]|uniref:asparagine synthase (glutamine-hydrolyzing) n=1 Tax=Hahella sp. HNIBRBA332 TaxID=3015983 RepID=UPI00273A8A85|nr:asparagine synthase (glutamine-hydrolyzing) [Hahella sp. HNIBRBA332]WLQ15452.1 asparagine synthase (glutamine-hydrolyzing) [Hahella sp. HNIBRBA332]
MCGIGGFYYKPSHTAMPDGAELLKEILAKQRHRGPDASAYWLNKTETVGLCHSRLAIIDLSPLGDQPMHSSCGKLTIVFNGEIYNYKELRIKYEALGYGFKTSSDTEVLLAAYQLKGKMFLEELRGMFSFALFDHQKNILICARDPIGKKPFIYAETDSGFYFSSEIPALGVFTDINRSIDHSALAAMLLHNLRHIPEPHTAFHGIKRLRPGHAMVVCEGKLEAMWRHWNPAPGMVRDAGELRDVIESAVAIRSQADVPVGALLSGGVDSSAIVALMKKHTNQTIRTYAFGAGPQDEDLCRARKVADLFGVSHKEFYFDANRQLQVFKTLLATWGEPIMLLPLIHTYEMSEAIHEDGIKVVMSGNGADELFFGYTGHFQTAKISRFLSGVALLLACARIAPDSWRRGPLKFLLERPGLRKAAYYKYKAAEQWPLIIPPDVARTMLNYVSEEMSYWGPLLPNKDFIDESNYLALLIENAHSITISSDLPAMMASVEFRAPFLDKEVIAAAMGIHFKDKVRKGGSGEGLKHILREAVRDLIPEEILYAPKRGFGMSIQEEDVLKGPWRQIGDRLFAEANDCDGLFDTKNLSNVWSRYLSGDGRVDTSTIARLFAIQLWRNHEIANF